MSNLGKVLHPEENKKQESLERRLSFYTQTGVWIDKTTDGSSEKAIIEYLMRIRRS